MGERRSAIIITATIVVVVGLVLAWAFKPTARDQVAAPLTEVTDAAAIQNHLQVSHLGIATSENFAGQKIRVIGATLKNTSDKAIRMVEVKLVFTGYDGRAVQDYTQKVLERNQKPLVPGSEYRFEVRQENLPRTWNFRVPVTQVTKIGY